MPDVTFPGRAASAALTRHFQDPASGALEPYVRAGSSGTTRTDLSGSIAAADTAQVMAVSNPNRRALGVQNTSGAELRLRSTGVASSSAGIRIPPGALYEAAAHDVPVTALSIWGATAGQTFVAWEA
ncbi:hypothetical protein [Falsiroseomonas sp. CW058]|uniref:hypothetical protein n=1 Tax=Falsiroseomonas sp. CW058 TaxID=3388664 RepID=UPI003D3188C5